MQYFDDILNVYAYLLSQAQQQAGTMHGLAQQTLQLHEKIDKTAKNIEKLDQDADAFLNDAIALANQMGIDISDILEKKEPVPDCGELPATITTDGRIKFPKDYNFEEGFEKLVQEAHKAGFTDVHPEQLLTREEMANAMAFAQQLDDEFEARTKLRGKDIAVLMAAVVIRVSFYYLKLFADAVSSDSFGADAPEKQPSRAAPYAGSGVDMGKVLKKNDTAAPLEPPFKPEPALNGIPLIFPTDGVIPLFSIREEISILQESASFDVEETDFLTKAQIIGYDKYLGWVFGVFNILTDTVTTKSMKSYSVSRLVGGTDKPLVDQEVSTLLQVVCPVLKSVREHTQSVIASIVREAVELGITPGDKKAVLELYEQAVSLEHQSAEKLNWSKEIMRFIGGQAGHYLDDVAGNSLMNAMIAAVHSLMYQSSDGELSQYAVRTNKIILYSGVMATAVNSIPALLIKDPAKIDFGGVISTLLSLFHSTAFWINVKTEFLVNEYTKALRPHLDRLDEEFDFV